MHAKPRAKISMETFECINRRSGRQIYFQPHGGAAELSRFFKVPVYSLRTWTVCKVKMWRK